MKRKDSGYHAPHIKLKDVAQRRKLSTTIGAHSYSYLRSMVESGKAESVGAAVDKTVELAQRLNSRAILERQTADYFKSLTPAALAEEADLEDALSTASLEIDFDKP